MKPNKKTHTSDAGMSNTSAIFPYNSLTFENPEISPVGLPWASWQWNTSWGRPTLGSCSGAVGRSRAGFGRLLFSCFCSFFPSLFFVNSGIFPIHTTHLPNSSNVINVHCKSRKHNYELILRKWFYHVRIGVIRCYW